MKLSEQQQLFTKDLYKLMAYAFVYGFEITLGEAYRTNNQQILYFYGYTLIMIGGVPKIVKTDRKSKTLNSNHKKRLAIDLNLFKDGKITWEWEDYEVLGRYWVSLDPKNRWGGSWSGNFDKKGFIDAPHFERQPT